LRFIASLAEFVRANGPPGLGALILAGDLSTLKNWEIRIASPSSRRYVDAMTAATVIEEIKHLPREEQARVLEFAFDLARSRQLSGKELSALAQRMVDSSDPAEVAKLEAELTRGFYGE
jgi:hypothetical protein